MLLYKVRTTICLFLTFFSLTSYGESKTITFSVEAVNSKAMSLTGVLTKPEGSGPFPAVVLMHGCSGPRYWGNIWADRLNAWGYVTVQVDSFGPRGRPEGVCGEGFVVSGDMRALDAHAAKRYLAQLPFVDVRRLAVMGMSHGGWSALAAVENSYFTEQTRPDPFKAAVAFYPWCPSHLYRLDAPALILIGEDDDWTLPWRCQNMELVGESAFEITLKVYPDTAHVFDIDLPERTYRDHVLRYNPEATLDAIERTKQFLAAHLK